MIDSMLLIWRLFLVQPPLRYLELVPWHLLGLLAVLGLLAAFGLHFLIGHVLGFYRRGERFLSWLSLPTLVLLVVLVQALLGVYLLAAHGDTLVAINLKAPGPGVTAERIGAALLKPAFDRPPLNQGEGDEFTREVLLTTLGGATDLEYRQALEAQFRTPSSLPSRPGKNEEGIPAETVILTQLALRWVLDESFSQVGQGNLDSGKSQPPNSKATEDASPRGAGRLPMFLVSLVRDFQPGVSFPRKEWEYITGSNLISSAMGQVLEEWLFYLALALAVGSLFIFMVFFLTLRWMKNLGRTSLSPSAKKTKPAASEPQTAKPKPEPVKGSANPFPVPSTPPEPNIALSAKSLADSGTPASAQDGAVGSPPAKPS